MLTVRYDVRDAVRSLVRSPAYTLTAIAVLALGIGATTSIFSFVDGVLLRPLPYPNPERIVFVFEKPPGGLRNGVATANFLDWRDQNDVFEAIAATTSTTMTLAGAGETARLRVGRVSTGYFGVFGIRAVLGRTLVPEDEQPGRDRVVVLSNRTWRSVFGADRGIVGRAIVLDGQTFTVIGVLPAGSSFDRGRTEVWRPLAFGPGERARNYHWLQVIARMKPGVTLEQARARMEPIAAQIAHDYPDIKKDWGITIDRFSDLVVNTGLRQSLNMLMAAVGMLLLVGCANLANIAMARGTAREREVVVRAALGASRSRIIRQFLTESLLLSLTGGALGIAAGYAMTRGLQLLMPPYYLPREALITIDWRVMLFVLAVSARDRPHLRNRAGVPRRTGRPRRLDARLVSRGHGRPRPPPDARRVDRRGSGARLHAARRRGPPDAELHPPAAGRSGQRSRDARHRGARDARRAVLDAGAGPGIPAPARRAPERGARHEPGRAHFGSADAGVDRRHAAADSEHEARRSPSRGRRRIQDGVAVVPGDDRPSHPPRPGARGHRHRIIHARRRHQPGVRQPVLRGRRSDRAAPPHRADPSGTPRAGEAVPWEIVGIAANERVGSLASDDSRGMYATLDQSPQFAPSVIVRTSGAAASVMAGLKAAAIELDPNQPLTEMRTVEDIRNESLGADRLRTWLVAAFSGIGAPARRHRHLRCHCLFGRAAHARDRRARGARREPRPRDGRSSSGMRSLLMAAGLALGIAGAVAGTRFMSSLLFGVQPNDLVSMAAAVLALGLVGLVAAWIPARRAAAVDPLVALRME